jgi:hypothetical protein
MALESTSNITRPGQVGATGDVDALHIEEYTGVVEQTLARKSALEGFVQSRSVRGTSIITNFAVGESTLQKVVPGTTPDGTVNKFGKNSLQVDTLVTARNFFPLLETWQTSYDARKEVGMEHGKKIAKFRDQAFFIQALKTAALTAAKHSGVNGAGHGGASQITMTGASDNLDPALLFGYIADLFVQMEQKDVDPRNDDVIIAVKPAEFYTLLQNEQLINTQYKTSNGTSIEAFVLKAYGVPVISSNNVPHGETIASHLLSNADNSNAYDGDFTKTVAVAFSPRALLAGETIPLTTQMFFDEKMLSWIVGSYLSFAVGPNRPEFAGLIKKP